MQSGLLGPSLSALARWLFPILPKLSLDMNSVKKSII